MESIVDIAALKEIFQHDERIGSFQEYGDRISRLHHRYLESQLRVTGAEQHTIDVEELLSFAEDAEFLATEYTNPLVIERQEGLPVEDVPSRKVVQDALALAGTIFEFLGDTMSSLEESTPASETVVELHQRIGKATFLYLRSALCYGLGIYEARTKVILSRLFDKLSVPENALDPSNAKQWEEYLLLALMSRNLRNITAAVPLVSSQSETIRLELRQSVASEHAFHEMRRWSPRNLTMLHTSLALIEACTGYAQAFLRGEVHSFEQAQTAFKIAISTVRKTGDYQFEWTIRTFHKVIIRMWADSPWIRLGELIPRRAYLRKLVEDGIVTLWSSQIAALEMQSKTGPLPGGYLNEESKRIIMHMPTSAGKTLLAQLAIAHQLFSEYGKQCVYVGPSRALCDQVANELAKRLSLFRIRVTSVVSDNDLIDDRYESLLFGESSVIVVTPEKLSYLFRQRSPFILNATLFIFDELHSIGKMDRGWIYEELISLLLQHPKTRETKMLFLSAAMPNHLTVQEWVDPEQSCEPISKDWQPTRMLKGVVRFTFTRPLLQQREVVLQGDLLYVRHKEDLRSPLRVSNFIYSKQVRDNTSERYWKRSSRLSDNEINHAAAAAARFAKLGPVLIYCPERADTVTCATLLAHRHDFTSPPLSEDDVTRYAETEEFISERLSQGHPLVEALRSRVAFHHGRLPRDVRNEIEYAFQKGWIRILVATTTLVEGVNFPIKTLLLMDYCQRYWNDQQKKWRKYHPLEKRDFKNIAGRAGRALYETEGQVIFIQSIAGFPYNPFDTGFEEYLALEATSPELNITSSLANDDLLADLSHLVEAVDDGRLTNEQLLFETSAAIEKREADVTRVVERLHTFTLLLQDQEMVGEEEESFIRIFQGTFLGKQQPSGAPQILGAFSHRSAKALRSLIPPQERSLFAQTGLKISTCRKLMERVRAYWERHRETINQFLMHSLDEDILRDIASIIYDLQDPEVDPSPVKVSPRKTITIDHMMFFVDWIWFDDSDRPYRHFSEINDKSLHAQAFTGYVRDALEYKASWTLSAFWLFSKATIDALYGIELLSTPLGQELILLPAYAKFGVKTPAAAFFSTIGLSPSHLTRELSRIYTELHPAPSDRYNYRQILQWILKSEPLDLKLNGLQPSFIRRVVRLLSSLKPLDEGNDGQETERSWEANFKVAGWQHCDGWPILPTLHRGSRLRLRREPDNPWDPNAIEISTEEGVKIGYVPRYRNQEVGNQMDFRAVKAIVSAVHPSAPDYEKVSVHCWYDELSSGVER